MTKTNEITLANASKALVQLLIRLREDSGSPIEPPTEAQKLRQKTLDAYALAKIARKEGLDLARFFRAEEVYVGQLAQDAGIPYPEAKAAVLAFKQELVTQKQTEHVAGALALAVQTVKDELKLKSDELPSGNALKRLIELTLKTLENNPKVFNQFTQNKDLKAEVLARLKP